MKYFLLLLPILCSCTNPESTKAKTEKEKAPTFNDSTQVVNPGVGSAADDTAAPF